MSLSERIPFFNIKDKMRREYTVEIPPGCPVCDVASHLLNNNIYSFMVEKSDFSANLYSCYVCPNCLNAFMTHYTTDYVNDDDEESVYPITGYSPSPYNKIYIQENIKDFSPRYCTVMTQAALAEQNSLNEICGIGYRKALEIIIKDYSKKHFPDCADKIEKCHLAECIKKYVEDEKIKKLAESAKWLGNNETHYLKEDSAFDLEDMKNYIYGVEAIISAELQCDKIELNRANNVKKE